MGWLQQCPDPQNLPRGLGAVPGPDQDPAPPRVPEVAPDPGPGSVATGKVCFHEKCSFLINTDLYCDIWS